MSSSENESEASDGGVSEDEEQDINEQEDESESDDSDLGIKQEQDEDESDDSDLGIKQEQDEDESDDSDLNVNEQQDEDESEDSDSEEEEESQKKEIKREVAAKSDLKKKFNKSKKQQVVVATDGDETEDSENEQQEVEDEKKPATQKIPFYTTKDDIKVKYEKRQGKTLHLLFPKRLPTDLEALDNQVKPLCDRIIKIRRPRQPSARFCLVDFESPEDLQKGFKQLKKVKIDGKKLHVKITKTDSEDFIKNIIERRKQKNAEKRAKRKLEKSLKDSNVKANKKKIYTAMLMLRNIPKTATEAEIKNHFPEAVEFKLVFVKDQEKTNYAIVTLPTPKDASKAKRSRIKIGENMLNISFAGVSNSYNKQKEKSEDAGKASIEQGTKNKQKNANKLKRELELKADECDEEIQKPKKKKLQHNSKESHKKEEAINESPSKKCKKSKDQKEFGKMQVNGKKSNQGTDEKNVEKFPVKNFNKKFQNKNSDFKKAAGKGNFNKTKKFDKSLKGGRKQFKNKGKFRSD